MIIGQLRPEDLTTPALNRTAVPHANHSTAIDNGTTAHSTVANARTAVRRHDPLAWNKIASQSTRVIPLPFSSSYPDLVYSYLLHSNLLATLVKISFLHAPVDSTAVLILGSSESRLKHWSTTPHPLQPHHHLKAVLRYLQHYWQSHSQLCELPCSLLLDVSLPRSPVRSQESIIPII